MPVIELITLPKIGQKYDPDRALEEEDFAVCVFVQYSWHSDANLQVVEQILQRRSLRLVWQPMGCRRQEHALYCSKGCGNSQRIRMSGYGQQIMFYPCRNAHIFFQSI